jgi:phosphatidylglycerophosphatase A
MKPDFRFVMAHPAHLIAFGFGVGLVRIIPGTWGSLLGIPLTLWLLPAYGDIGFGLIVAGAFAVGVWAADITGKRLGVADHRGIVWDEVVGQMLVLWLCPTLSMPWIVTGFVLFRIFDIIKLPPARYFDTHWKHGLGVMMDDLAAAVHSVIAIALIQRIGALL